jgi:hypothetical protein
MKLTIIAYVCLVLTTSACNRNDDIPGKIAMDQINTMPNIVSTGALITCGTSVGTAYIRSYEDTDVFTRDKISKGQTDLVIEDVGNVDIRYRDAVKTRSALKDGATITLIHGYPKIDSSFAVLETYDTKYGSDPVVIVREFSFGMKDDGQGIMLTMITKPNIGASGTTAKMLVSDCQRRS